jgi:hypothetical protein
VVSHLSAALALGLPTVGDLSRSCVTVQRGTALRNLARVHLHRATLSESDVVELDGYRATAPARTVLDLARERGVRAGVVAADHSLHTGLIDRADLKAALDACAGWPGRRSARIVVALADGASESVLESLSRLSLDTARLPTPWLQPSIYDEGGRFLGRCDFYWDDYGVVGEADGDLKYEPGRAAIVAERRRQQWFEQTGLIVVRWGWADVFDFGPVASRLRTAYARGERPASPRRGWRAVPLHA